MKFVCDNCKAKYQIGDDKVSGKTVRMKCRRCGHLILVSAAVTESSVSRQLPAEGTQLGTAGTRPSRPAAGDADLQAGTAPASSSAADLIEDEEDGHTAIMTVPPQLAGRPPPPARPSTGGLRMPMGAGPLGPGPIGAGPPSSRGAPAAPRSSASPAAPIARPPGVPARPTTGGVTALGGTPRPPPARPATIPRVGGATPVPGSGGTATGGFVPQATPSAPSLADLSQRSMASAISAAARSSTPVPPGARSAPPASARMTASQQAGAAGGGLSAGGGPFAGGSPSGGAALHGEGQAGGFGPVASQASSGLGPDRGPDGAAGPGPGGVAGAFQRAVAGTQPVLRTDTPGEDWYVGVGGVPLGPVRLSVIREKVDQGAVDGESLVWREGFDEWQPLRNVPGLRAILDERRVSVVPEGPRVSATSPPRVSAPTPVPGAMHVSSSLHAAPTPAPPAVNGANGHGALALGNVPTGGVSLGPATAPAAGSTTPEPLAAGDLLGAAAATAAATAAAAPGAAAIPPAATAPPTPSLTPSIPPPARERRGMHPFAYAMIAMAAVFGGVAAWVLLKPAPQQVIVVQASAPATPGLAAAPPPPPTADEPSTATSADPGAAGSKVASGGPGGPRSPSTTTPTGKPGEPPPNLGSFDQGLGGPSSGPGKDGPGSGRGQLSEGEISGVVQRNMPGVRRRCWQPALDARSASAPKSARVSTSITISPSGSVSGVSASGSEQHFPGLSSCIGGAIRGWQFPPSDGPTTVNVPFSFNAQ